MYRSILSRCGPEAATQNVFEGYRTVEIIRNIDFLADDLSRYGAVRK